jgi:mono/diheme cytochrome c family protein
MGTILNILLGLVFVILSGAATFLMYHLWGYPFDHQKLRSDAPRRLLFLHRLIGYAYLGIYVYLMIQMVPRLWSYEIELPARTVAHLIFGWSIGIILLVKIAIVRFFKHLESTLVPFLGTLLFLCTCLVVGLSVPFALKEDYLSRSAVGGTVFSAENIQRVKLLLPHAGLPERAPLAELASTEGFQRGRDILLNRCVQCHDLRTVLVKPRSPETWVQTVRRMAERAVLKPISESQQWYVSAYLIAVSPELQESLQEKLQQDRATDKSKASFAAATKPGLRENAAAIPFDMTQAKQAFEDACSQCHSVNKVAKSPPASVAEVRTLVARMVDNGLEATPRDLEAIIFYLTQTYVK